MKVGNKELPCWCISADSCVYVVLQRVFSLNCVPLGVSGLDHKRPALVTLAGTVCGGGGLLVCSLHPVT